MINKQYSLFLPLLLLLLLLNQQLFCPQLFLLLLEVLLLKHLLDASSFEFLVAGLAHIAGVFSGFAQTRFANKAVPVIRPCRFSAASSERVNYVGSDTAHVFWLGVGRSQAGSRHVVGPVWLELLYRHIWSSLSGLFFFLLSRTLPRI